MPAPKKKPTTPKKTVASKTDAQRRTPNPNKTASKRVTVKKTESRTAPKAQPKKSPKAPSTRESFGIFSWSQWTDVFNQAINTWLAIFWRYAVVVIITVGLNLLGVFTLSATLLALFGGISGLENIVANLYIGTLPDPRILAISGLVFLAWLCYFIYIAVLSKIAVFSLIKGDSLGKPKSALGAFFQDGNRLCLRYVGLSLMTFFYVIWPLLALIGFAFAWEFFRLYAPSQVNIDSLLPVVTVIAFVATVCALVYLVYAAIRVLFALPLLVQTQQTAAQTFHLAKAITAGNWWFTALMWVFYVLLLYALNVAVAQVAILDPIVLIEAADPRESLRLTDLLAFFMSLFIFGPITTAFQYCLMLRCAKNQSVKI